MTSKTKEKAIARMARAAAKLAIEIRLARIDLTAGAREIRMPDGIAIFYAVAMS